jgi:hypothetical protein
MIKKMMVILLMVLFVTLLGAETKVTPMPKLMKPQLIFLDKTQMYITEDTSIYIYSLKDFKLIKKFGKRGEGPREFMIIPQIPLTLNVQTGDIIVQSFGKLSWFSKKGEYKKELKLANPIIIGILPFGKNFVGMQVTQDQKRWRKLNLYDDKINELKNITKMEDVFQQGKGMVILKTQPFNPIYDNKLFLAWENDLIIKVLDTELKELFTIKHDIEKQKITEKNKKDIIHFLKTSPQTKDFFEFLKPIKFTTHFPAIQNLIVTDNKIYVATNKTKEEQEENDFIIFDIKGKFLKQGFFPLKMSTPIQPYPYTIYEDYLYQLVEDVDEEEWALHVTEIK